MKIAVVGAGAMGSIYAALLADAGNEVWAIDTWRVHIAKIQTDGLRVTGASGDRVVTQVHAVDGLADVPVCDLYIIATKAAGVGPAAHAIAAHQGSDSLVLTIQNGLGAGERIAAFMPTENVLLGVADGFGAGMKGPGHVHHTSMKLIRIGEMQGGLSARVQQVAQVWRDAGFNAKAFADINQLIWEKLICNVTLSAPCTVFGSTVAELRADSDHWAIALGCASEAFAVGQALGVAFSFDDPIDYATTFAQSVGDAKPSMYQDHLAARRSELDAINGAISRLSKPLGIATPFNDVLTAVLRDREAGFKA